MGTLPSSHDALLLLALALGCTLLPFALSLVALRHLSAYSAQLAVNLEPVYAIALAVVMLGEQRELAPAFYFRSEEPTSELPSLMRISYAVFCLHILTQLSKLS